MMPTTASSTDTLVLHAHWTEGALAIWAESGAAFDAFEGTRDLPLAESAAAGAKNSGIQQHPFAADALALARLVGCEPGEAAELCVRLPAPGERDAPTPSPHLSHAVGHLSEESDADLTPVLATYRVECVRIAPARTARVLERLEALTDSATSGLSSEPIDERLDDDLNPTQEGQSAARSSSGEEDRESGLNGIAAGPSRVVLGESVRFFAAAARFVRHLLAQQRFVPMVMQDASGVLRGSWQLWLADEATSAKLATLMRAMPPMARAAVDPFRHDGWTMLESYLHALCDSAARATLIRETLNDAIDGRDPNVDAHVSWLTGLLAQGREIQAGTKSRADLVKGARQWVSGLDDRSATSAWRLLLRLTEPIETAAIGESGVPADSVRWTVTLFLQSAADPTVRLDAADLWALPGGGSGAANVEGQRIEAPGEVLLAELSRAARLWKKLESLLNETEPSQFDLNSTEAYRFLREIKPILTEQGVGVEVPAWWDQPSIRLGARMIVESENVDLSGWMGHGPASSGPTQATIGLNSLVNYRWQIAVGDTTLTFEQFERLAAQHSPLIRLNGKWVEIRPEDVKAAIRFIRENPGGQMEVGKALRLAYASDHEQTGLAILGMEATGWVATVFGDASTNVSLPMLESPRGFVGTLRPYQLKGLSWLAFLDRFGLGTCLADDMGLGKTIQLLALLAHEAQMRELQRASNQEASRESAGEKSPPHAAASQTPPSTSGSGDGPTLLVVPMSVVPNWLHEARRFTPSLRVLVHHGPERLSGQSLLDAALNHDVLVTTYTLAHRDSADLAKVPWGRVVLDEAQNIKNPTAKQTRAIREIDAPRKIALTGTPVENRLGELWSIMDFLNPGYLGSGGEFRRKFAVPIERYHDRHRSAQLRGLVQPFVLRRLKSDPAVISDLPEKVESKEFCYLTPEQASLYQSCVNDMLATADRSTGIQRRGVVLAGLIKLKQICNHPAQFLKEFGAGSAVDDDSEAPSAGAAEKGTSGALLASSSLAGGPPATSNRGVPLPSRSGKCQRLVEMLDEVVAAGDKALVFTQFRQMGHILAAMLRRELDRDVLFLHGGTPTQERQRLIHEFQGDAPTSSGRGSGRVAPIFILSLKAGGVGLNLTAANHVFHFDRWWNPAVEAQATDRAYRIGQTRTVQVHKFVTAGTLEERIDQMIESKMELALEVIGSGEDWLTELNTNQLRDLLTLRTEAVAQEGES